MLTFDPYMHKIRKRYVPCTLDAQARSTYDKYYRMWANAQRDGRPAEYRWRPLFNAAKFG